ncbi:MAG TPA: PAS domain S-box protein [Proteobacteria bacterium]|nr:PAS domain S-box protein [Pseudomonadota bacterium]
MKDTEFSASPLRQLLIFRLFLISLLLGVLILIEGIWPQKPDPIPIPLYSFIALSYLLTIFHAVSLKRKQPPEPLIQQQLLLDATLIAGLIYLTGGFYSLFFPFFYFIILGGTLYLKSQQTVTLLFYCTFLYLLIIFTHIHNPLQELLPLPPLFSSNRKIVSQLFFNLAPFYLTAFILRVIAKERVSTRKRLQQVTSDLQDFRDLNEHIIASIDSGLITTDQQLNIVSINPAGSTLLGRSAEEIKQLGLAQVIPDLPEPSTGNQRRQRHEINYQSPRGERLVLGFSFTPLRHSRQHQPGWIISFRDLTNLKEIEERLQAARKMTAIGRLAAGIAHEIRNPLAAISGSIEILARDLPPGDDIRQRLLQIVLRESSRLDHLISDFLSFSRLEGKEQHEVKVIKRLRDLVFLFHSQFPEISFHEDYEDEDFTILANPEQLEQIFWNLCKNALEAVGQNGRIQILSRNLRFESQGETDAKATPQITESANHAIQISIIDDGPGISDVSQIFEPFYSTKDQGTGLGLYIVFQLTRINHGEILINNRDDGRSGTCARIRFPGLIKTEPEKSLSLKPRNPADHSAGCKEASAT